MFLYDSFSRPLPNLPQAPGWKEKLDTHWSSPLTEIKYPPTYWEEVPVDHYLQKAKRELGKPSVKHYLQVHGDPSMDPLMKMGVEADVVRYSNEQLALPVNHALFASVGGGKIECYSESESQGSRPDKIWKRASANPSGGKSEGTFALFESKIKRTILQDEFAVAKLSTPGDVAAKVKSASKNPKKTHFDGKSLKIMCQAAKYANNASFNSNYVALFDLEWLFLCVFDRTDPLSVKGTMVPCQGPDSKDARLALLGWLIEAWEEELAGRNTAVPAHPLDSGDHQTRSKAKTAARGTSTTFSAVQSSSHKQTTPDASAPKASASKTSNTRNVAQKATLPVRSRKQKINPVTKKPMFDKDGKPIYESD
ncbi:hypothetical protein NEMBOFW57_003891 [Staphylotrichum longicolle]|uniref:Uncharacterized protein n=1 Tax=Staphylotrichum longicolle TaxID=669026 RepID=A0AAD4F5G2_9PEZI|nr:hypothetical protein NEMBOFW57_003891 [Staphylotrichum longicolle]